MEDWISVDDKLPEIRIEDLEKEYGEVMSENASDFGVEFLTVNVLGDIEVSDFWVKNQRFDFGVTHWMPLPKLPKEYRNGMD